MSNYIKELLLYAGMFFSLGLAIALPVDNFTTGVLRGALIGIFIVLIPEWVKIRSKP